MQKIDAGQVETLDVRPILAGGVDPFKQIMTSLKTLAPELVLEVINTFEPVPLIKILNKKRYANYVKNESGTVYAYFLRIREEQEEIPDGEDVFRAPFYIAAGLISMAVVFFAVNIFVTSRRSAKRSIEREFILTSVLWLLFTVAAGVTLGLNLTQAFLSTPHLELLKLHAHAGIAGWFIQLIIGVGSRLLPMFMVAHDLTTARLRSAYWAVNGGLLAGVFALILQWRPGVVIGIAGVMAGIILFLSFLSQAYRKRVKKQLDIGMRQSALSFVILLAPLLLILFLAFASKQMGSLTLPMTLAYGSALLLGFITSLIMGQTYKTLPFIVWLKVYRGRIGKGKIPLPKDLYNENAAKIQLWLFAAGFFTLLAGILLQLTSIIAAGGMLLFFATALYNFNILKIILHKPVIA